MKLRIVGSSSKGNGYLLEDSNGEQLLIEAGCRLRDYQTAGHLKISQVRGMLISHEHGDHAKYVRDFTRVGIEVLSTASLKEKNKFGVTAGEHGKAYRYGDYMVAPIAVEHDVECFAYIVYHKEMGTLFFATDCWNLHQVMKGVNHFLIEANYSDCVLDNAVTLGKTLPSLADRVRLSHMSLEHCVEYLRMCEAEKTARTITLIHASERHLDKEVAKARVEQAFGVPTWMAEKGLEVELA